MQTKSRCNSVSKYNINYSPGVSPREFALITQKLATEQQYELYNR